MADDNIHITLIHGTFATNAPWTKPGSVLRDSLSKSLGDAVVFHDTFQWSGWACHLSRHRAAIRLQQYLLDITEREPGRHFIIGHSHGGMVALYALRNQILGQRIEGLVTLSTPFLVARRREISLLGWMAVAISMIAAVIGAAFFIMLPALGALGLIPDSSHLELSSWPILFVSGITSFVVVLGVLVVLAFLFQDASEFFDRTLDLPSLHPDRILVVRGPSDEASALMTLFHALELLVTSVWGRRGPLDGFIASKLKAVSARFSAAEGTSLMMVIVGWALLGLPVFIGLFGLFGYTRFMQVFHGAEVKLITLWIFRIEYSAWEYLSGLPSWCLILGGSCSATMAAVFRGCVHFLRSRRSAHVSCRSSLLRCDHKFRCSFSRVGS